MQPFAAANCCLQERIFRQERSLRGVPRYSAEPSRARDSERRGASPSASQSTVRKPELRAGGFDRASHVWTLVARQVVHHDDVTGARGRDENLFDVGEKAGPIDGPVEHPRRGHARDAQRGEKRRGVPPAVGRVIDHVDPAPAARIATDEIRAHAAFIQKHQPRGVKRRGRLLPQRAGEGDVSAVVFGRAYGFFKVGIRVL